MKRLLIIFSFCFFFLSLLAAQLIDFDQLETDSVVDVEGNVYPTVLFGDTWWMATNLRTKHYNDGSEMLQMTQLMDASDSENDWSWWIGSGRWGYPNFESNNIDTYGLLYSWDALTNTQNEGVCPDGWQLADTSDWFNMARLIVGDENVIWEEGERPTPDGGTETYYEISSVKKVGRFLKSDNGDLWTLSPTISRDCNGAMMNITPSGEISIAINGFGTQAEFWTPNYVHSDSTGQGRRYILFSYDNHTLVVSRNHRARLRCARCVKKAHLLAIGADSIVLDSVANSSCTVDITANCNWTASSKSSWLSVTQNVDSANGEIAIKTLEANTGTNRTDTVFIAIDDAEAKYILVTQKGSKTSAGTEEYFSRENVSIYPNPVRDKLNIVSDREIKQVVITDLTGKKIIETQQCKSLDMSGLSPDIYLVKVIVDRGVVVQKVMKK